MPPRRVLTGLCVAAAACTVLVLGVPRAHMAVPDTATRSHAWPAQGAVPTPRVFCETPTPGAIPTTILLWPDLVIRGMALDHAPCRTCADKGPYLGVVLEVGNQGVTRAAPFLVEVNGSRQAVGVLHPSTYINVWFPGVVTGEVVAVVDPLNQVMEAPSDGENNNVLRGVLAPPTFVPAPVTCTPAPTPAARPDLVVSRMSIGLRRGWHCGLDPVLGVFADFENRGGASAAEFVVTVNGTPFPHGGLAVGAAGSVWAPGYRHLAEQEAVVDAAGQVAESDEGNNVRRELVPIPTLPPCPSPTPSRTPGGSTVTPGPSPTVPSTPTPSLTVTSPATPSLTLTSPPTPARTSTPTPTPSAEPTALPRVSFVPILYR